MKLQNDDGDYRKVLVSRYSIVIYFNFMENLKSIYLKVVLENYANFNGRVRRREFWMFCLADCIIRLTLILLGVLLVGVDDILGSFMYYVVQVYLLALLIPFLALGARRLHDIGKSGWFQIFPMLGMLISLISVVCYFIFFDGHLENGWFGIFNYIMIIFFYVPIACGLLLMILYAIKGTPGENKYGTNPKEVA